MGYCTVDQVAAIMQQTFSTDTKPTTSQVQSLIDDVSYEVDMVLSRIGVSLPITNTTALGMLRLRVREGVACQIGNALFGQTESLTGTATEKWCNAYSDFLKKLADDPAIIGVAVGDDISVIESNATDGSDVNFDDQYYKDNGVW